jgi:DNA-binding NtrC family response regulator
MPAIRLTPDAVSRLEDYGWPGNVRELKSVAERISVMETERLIDSVTLAKYLQNDLNVSLPALAGSAAADYISDRDIIFKMIMQLKQEIEALKERLDTMPDKGVSSHRYVSPDGGMLVSRTPVDPDPVEHEVEDQAVQEVAPEAESASLSINDKKKELIKKALEKYHGNRKMAAEELGISERTLYRKIKDLGL